MKSPFWIIKKILRVITIVLPVLTILVTATNTNNVKAASCQPLTYITQPTANINTTVSLIPSGTATVILAYPGLGTVDGGTFNLSSPWTQVISSGQVRYESTIPQTVPSSLTLTMDISGLNLGDGFGVNFLILDQTTGNTVNVDCSPQFEVPLTPPVAGQTVFPTSSITQYTDTIVSYISNNILIIIGILAFSSGIIMVVGMFSKSTRGTLMPMDKVGMLSRDGYNRSDDPRFSWKNRKKSPDNYPDYWKE